MLGGIRAAQSTWIGKAATTLVFAFIVLAFVVWGIGDVFRGVGTNQVAQVGAVSVSAAAYRQAFQTELQNLQQRARRPISSEEAHRFGLDAQVLSRLMSDAALDDRARTMGLAISDVQVAKSILADPSFAGPGGGFDRVRFNAVLRENGFTEQSFVREQRQTYLRQELVGAMVGGLTAPLAAVDALHRYEAETRSLDYLVLPAAAAGDVPQPDETTLQSYYDAHKGAFTAPQYRKLVVLAETPTALAKPDAVSDADAMALYDQVKGTRYATPERRAVQQAVFPAEQDAAAASARVRAGEAFDDVVKDPKLGGNVADLGTVGKDAIFDHAVADAAFNLPAGGTSGPIKGAFGTVLAHVATIQPADTKPFADVAPALKTEIATKRAAADYATLHGRIEDARASGKTLSEAASSVGLQARTVEAVDATGRDTAGQPIEGLTEKAALLKGAFASDIGVDNDTISTADGGSIWFEVAGIDPARQLTLTEAKSQVDAAWREEQTARRLDAKAADLVKEIDAGRQTLEQVAAASGNLPVVHVSDAKRSGAQGLGAGVVAKVFDVPVNAAASAPMGATSRVLFKVLDSSVPPLDAESPDTKQLAARYQASLQDGIVNAYLGKLGARLGTKVNQEAVRAASGY